MDELLLKVPLSSSQGGRKLALFVEVPVFGEAAPFLVSGTKKLVWIEKQTNLLRAAIRDGEIGDSLSPEVVGEIAHQGKVRGWENGFPFSQEGLAKAVEYVRSYGIEEVEILVGEEVSLTPPEGVSFFSVPWIASNQAVVVPVDRTYLGMIGTIGASRWTVIVHNPSRGMSVVGDW